MDPIQLAGMGGPMGLGGATPGVGGMKAASPTAAPGRSFAEFMYERLDEVNRLQNEANSGVQRLLTGETDNVAEVFAASNKAGIAFDLLMEVRNKLIDAYREIQQMRV